MKGFKDIIQEEKYKNWVKCTLGIAQTGKTLCEYVSRKFYLYLEGKATLYNPGIQSYLTKEEYSHFRDDMKSGFRNNVTKYVRLNKKGKWYWDTSLSKGDCTCPSILEKLLCLHKSQKDIRWENIDGKQNLSPEWVIAKIFMPMGNKDNKGPDDTDPSAIFKVISKCDLFMNPIRENKINNVIEARNAIFHSSDNLVDLEKYFTYMENVLSDASNDPDIDDDLKRSIDNSNKRIVQLRKSEITMTLFEDAQKAMRNERTTIYYKFEQCLCDNDPAQLQELFKLADKLGSDLEFINFHFDDIKSQGLRIEELEKQIYNKNCKIEQQTTIFESQYEEITKMSIDIKANGNEIQNLEERLKEKSKEYCELQDKSRIQLDRLRKEIENNEATITDLLQQKNNLERLIHEQNSEFTDIFKNRDVILQQLEYLQHNNELQRRKIDSLEWETIAIAGGLALTSLVFLGL